MTDDVTSRPQSARTGGRTGGKDTVRLEELTWPEVEAAVAAGTRTIFIVAASIEQHGPHLPLVTDTAIGEAVGERLARALGNALLAPPIRPACSDHHLAFPGQPVDPGGRLHRDGRRARALAGAHGFDTFVLFSSHGGNFVPLERAARRLREEHEGRGVRIIAYAGLPALMEMMQVMVGTAAAMGVPQDVDAIHADATETSIMMACHPDLVEAARLEVGYLGRSDPHEIFTRGMRAITPNGIFRDPRAASPAIGEAVLARLVEHLAAFVRSDGRMPGAGGPARGVARSGSRPRPRACRNGRPGARPGARRSGTRTRRVPAGAGGTAVP